MKFRHLLTPFHSLHSDSESQTREVKCCCTVLRIYVSDEKKKSYIIVFRQLDRRPKSNWLFFNSSSFQSLKEERICSQSILEKNRTVQNFSSDQTSPHWAKLCCSCTLLAMGRVVAQNWVFGASKSNRKIDWTTLKNGIILGGKWRKIMFPICSRSTFIITPLNFAKPKFWDIEPDLSLHFIRLLLK